MPPGTRVTYAGGDQLRLSIPAALRGEQTTRDAATETSPPLTRDAITEMNPPLCEHHRDEWRLETEPAGLDHLGRRRFRTRVIHTYEVPGRMLYTYGGEPYVQHGGDVAHAGQPSLGGFLPPGAPPPTRCPEQVPQQFWEQLFRQTEVQRGPPPPPPGLAPPSGQPDNAKGQQGRPGLLRVGPLVPPTEAREPRQPPTSVQGFVVVLLSFSTARERRGWLRVEPPVPAASFGDEQESSRGAVWRRWIRPVGAPVRFRRGRRLTAPTGIRPACGLPALRLRRAVLGTS